jgi:hypothetical protein
VPLEPCESLTNPVSRSTSGQVTKAVPPLHLYEEKSAASLAGALVCVIICFSLAAFHVLSVRLVFENLMVTRLGVTLCFSFLEFVGLLGYMDSCLLSSLVHSGPSLLQMLFWSVSLSALS